MAVRPSGILLASLKPGLTRFLATSRGLPLTRLAVPGVGISMLCGLMIIKERAEVLTIVVRNWLSLAQPMGARPFHPLAWSKETRLSAPIPRLAARPVPPGVMQCREQFPWWGQMAYS